MKLILMFLTTLTLYACTGLQQYEKTVDSRSIEGYAKDVNDNPQGGIKYTVHYK